MYKTDAKQAVVTTMTVEPNKLVIVGSVSNHVARAASVPKEKSATQTDTVKKQKPKSTPVRSTVSVPQDKPVSPMVCVSDAEIRTISSLFCRSFWPSF